MKKPHYAWAVCLGCTLMLFVCGGLSVNAFSVTQPYILDYGGFTNTQTSLITTLRAVSYLGCMFLSPLFFRRTGYRLGAALATLFSAVSFLVYGLSRSLAGFYLGGILAGLGYGFGSMIPATILLSRWFHRQKGLALGLCSAGTGLAMVAFSPLLTALCETYSLQICFFAEAAFSFLCAVAVFALVRDTPASCALAPYGEQAAPSNAAQAPRTTAPRFSLRRTQLAALFFACILFGAIASPGPSHLMILYTTAGAAPHAAALAVSIFGLTLMVGKCLYGTLCDRIGGARAGWCFGGLLCVGLGLCAAADSGSLVLMFLGVALYGLGVPLATVGLSVWANDFGGEHRVDALVQRFQLCYGIGALALSTIPGLFADWTGSYAPAYAVLLLGAAGCLLIVQTIYHQKNS